MKNKALTYVLIVAVGFIWYKVFVRVVSNFGNETEFSAKSPAMDISFKSVAKDTFEVDANYRDPFGVSKKNTSLKSESTELVTEQPKITIKKKNVVQWSDIRYKGLVKRSESSNPLALIYIDGNQIYMRQGESVFDGIRLKKIYRDSIIVFYKKERKILYRK